MYREGVGCFSRHLHDGHQKSRRFLMTNGFTSLGMKANESPQKVFITNGQIMLP